MRKVELVTADILEHLLADSLLQGQMPDHFLYIGDSGARNWLALENTSDFASIQLQSLLEESLPSMLELLQGRNLVSLGVGRGEKERVLLRAMSGLGSPKYLAVDINIRMLDAALTAVSDIDINKLGLVAFIEDLALIRDHWVSPAVLCLLGNSYCCYNSEFLLKLVYDQIEPDDLFMFDCHLLPSSSSSQEQAEDVCRSRRNVLFNIGPLIDRGMEPDACVFNLELIEQETNGGRVRIASKWLDIIKDSTVCCGMSNIHLEAGKRLELGATYRYTYEQVPQCLCEHGFRILRSFTSSNGEYLLVLAQKR